MHPIEGAPSYTPKQVTDHQQRRSLLAGFLFRFACFSTLPIVFACMINCGKNGFCFPAGGIGLPSFWAQTHADGTRSYSN
jgi:hypothetical protein